MLILEQMSIVYAVVSSAKGTVSAFNGAARLDVSDLAGKLIQQVDFNVDTKKSYSSKGYVFVAFIYFHGTMI
jgi:hypothetical protein